MQLLLLLLQLLPLSLRLSDNAIVGDQLQITGNDAAESGPMQQQGHGGPCSK